MTEAPHVFRTIPILIPQMELAALKSSLLTFDLLLQSGELQVGRFTRSPTLENLRYFIRQAVMQGQEYPALLRDVTWGIQNERIEEVQSMRLEADGNQTDFEHILIAEGDPVTGTLDMAWLLAGMDLYTFRLCQDWRGSEFTIIAGCGILRDTATFGPHLLDRKLRLGLRGDRNALYLMTGSQRESISDDISNHRHECYQRATSLVEFTADEFVRHSILNEARFTQGSDPRTIAAALERRARRFYRDRIHDQTAEVAFTRTVRRILESLPPGLLREQIEPDGSGESAIHWDVWICIDRQILSELVPFFGLPGYFFIA